MFCLQGFGSCEALEWISFFNMLVWIMDYSLGWVLVAAAAAKSFQSCLILCDPIDGNPPGSPVPGILQARTLEWVAISFSNAWKWKVKVKSFSRVRLSATPWTVAHQAPPSMGFSRQEYWSGVLLLVLVGMWIRLAVFDFELWLNSGWIRLKRVSSSTSGWAWMCFRIYWDGL